MTENTPSGNFEFVRKYSYRDYKGERTSRFQRIFSLATFEMKNTWKKSTIGKILLGFVIFLNVFFTFILVQISSNVPPFYSPNSFVRDSILKTLTDYISISSESPFLPSVQFQVSNIFNIGFFIIPLLAIAGSGFFADDKEGKVLEIYLSRMRRGDYTLGKFLGMFFYSNLFITVPYLIISFMWVQGYKLNQFDFLGLYIAVGLAGAIISAIFTIFILIFSSMVEKRAYASLAFFIGYILYDSLASGLYNSDPSNQFLLLIVPTYLFTLLIYVLGGNLNLGYVPGGPNSGHLTTTLLLNDGIGLEYWHVYLFVITLILVGLLFLLFRVHRITTNEI